MDESIVIHDAVARRMWAPEGARPICVVTGSHQRTVLFGALSLDGRQLFRQYAYFNEDTCLDFLKKIHRKFRKLYLFLDRAPQHYKSEKVLQYLRKNRATLRVRWFPVGCPEFNVVEECWRQTDNALLASRYYPSFPDLKTTIASYLRTRRFNLNMRRYLLTNRGC
jgi:transposase